MTSTDTTIEIECSECGDRIEGVEEMAKHILAIHFAIYDAESSARYARLWADDAYEKEEEFLADYYKQRKEDPSE